MRNIIPYLVMVAVLVFLPASHAAAGDDGAETVKCPSCGRMVNIGRHGQTAGETFKCPYCGREICPKEEEKGFCFGADAAFLSKYVSRGVTTTDGAVFEPDAWVSYRGFTASVWGNMDLSDVNRTSGRFNELDFALDYSGGIDKINYSVGAIYYTYPNTAAADTSEVYAGLGYDVLLKPKLAVYYDFWRVDGFYFCLSVGHGFELPELVRGVKSSFELSAQAGFGTNNFNEFNFGARHAAVTDIVLTGALPVSVTDGFTVKPLVSYSTVPDRAIRSKNAHNDNVIWGGVASLSF